MSIVDQRYRHDPGRVPREGKHRTPKNNEDHRDLNRRDERLGNGDRSRTRPPHGHEQRPPETRHAQDRPREERTREVKEASRDRHRADRGMDSELESRDRYREDRSQQHGRTERKEGSRDRNRDERSREESHYRQEGVQDRSWEERSRDAYQEKPRPRERDRYWDERGQSVPRDAREIDFHQESAYYKKDALALGYGPPPQSPTFDERDYYESERGGGILECNKCRYLCTGRACCQLVEVLLNMLILVCASVSYNSTGGFTGITNMGGIYYYAFGGAYSGFQGADGEKAQELDVAFYQLKLPTVSATMAFGGALMGFSCLMIVIGVFRLPWYFPIWLLVECILDTLIACGYVPALYFYFRKLLDAYATQVCADREALYKSKGYSGFSCALHGADIAAGLLGCLAIVAFFLSAFLAVRGFRRVRLMKKQQSAQNLEL